MGGLLVRRGVGAILLVWLVVTVTFGLVELMPGDAADIYCQRHVETQDRLVSPEACESYIRKFHLDEPLHRRYVGMIVNLARGDFGNSLRHERPVFTLIGERLPNTLLLSACSLLACLGSGVLLGALQALFVGRFVDRVLGLLSSALYAMPEFLVGMLLLHVFVLRLGLASAGAHSVVYDELDGLGRFWDRAAHLVLPVLALTLSSMARVARLFRSRLLEILDEPFILAGRARGLAETRLLFRHALRNALGPVVTLAGLSLPYLFSGSVVVEFLFNWPGVGRLIYEAIHGQDVPLLVGAFLISSVLVVLGNLLADVCAALLDPRTRQTTPGSLT